MNKTFWQGAKQRIQNAKLKQPFTEGQLDRLVAGMLNRFPNGMPYKVSPNRPLLRITHVEKDTGSVLGGVYCATKKQESTNAPVYRELTKFWRWAKNPEGLAMISYGADSDFMRFLAAAVCKSEGTVVAHFRDNSHERVYLPPIAVIVMQEAYMPPIESYCQSIMPYESND